MKASPLPPKRNRNGTAWTIKPYPSSSSWLCTTPSPPLQLTTTPVGLLRLDDGEEATRHLVDVGNIVPKLSVYRFPMARLYTS